MPTQAIEGIVENGRVRLPESVQLPEQTRVYVIVPDLTKPIRMMSPRLLHPEQAADFDKVVVSRDDDNAGL